ncbi:hypothetical protein TNCV_1955641 [Trichonephila clavipes]|nr:hypothetical protein TNCV_1955641 [Trichonephila clavipes]
MFPHLQGKGYCVLRRGFLTPEITGKEEKVHCVWEERSAELLLGRRKWDSFVRLARLGKTPMESLEMLSKAYGEPTMAKSKVYERHRRFKEGRESIEDNERPSTSRNVKNPLVSECVRKNRR